MVATQHLPSCDVLELMHRDFGIWLNGIYTNQLLIRAYYTEYSAMHSVRKCTTI